MKRQILLGIGILSILLFFTRCGKLESEPASGTFGSVYKILKNNNCLECHIPSGAAYITNGVTLDFTSQTTAYNTLTTHTVTGITSGGSSGACSTVKIVKAGNPTQSFLAAVLFSSYSTTHFAGKTGCTPYPNHHSDTHLNSSEQTSLINWITNGAAND